MSDPIHQESVVTCDLLAGYTAHAAELTDAVQRVLSSGWYILGREVDAFEAEFATFIGSSHAVGVANGTDALALALKASGLKAGDAVITVSHTAVATVAAIEMAGMIPILVDIDSKSYTIDPSSVVEAIANSGSLRPAIKAIVPVHLYGHPADMAALMDIARRHELRVIEDCSQSHGATWEGQMTGTFGDAAAFSLYPTKNLGALGDAGIVTTSNSEINDQLRLLRQYGWRSRNDCVVAGVNSRLDELQAAVLRVKLKSLTAANESRQKIAQQYTERLLSTKLVIPKVNVRATHVFHQYVVQSTERDELLLALRNKGIHCLVHYPKAVHQQIAYSHLPRLVPLSVTEKAVMQILSLPMYPELPKPSVTRTIDHLVELVLC